MGELLPTASLTTNGLLSKSDYKVLSKSYNVTGYELYKILDLTNSADWFRNILEAFGASNVLQEILTIKSDDVTGRSRAYEAIVKGDPMPTPGIPESLNVLLHELRGLGLSIKLD